MSKFELGRLIMTEGVAALTDKEVGIELYFEIADCVSRHQSGDWGNLCEEDKRQNDYAVNHQGRLLSAYEVGKEGTKIWIITEWDRSVTTILLPEEY